MDLTEASDIILNIMQIIGTIAFAASGALAAGRRKMDWFGVVVLAVIVAVGGGSLRDMLLGLTPVFWVQSTWFVALAGITALAVIPLNRVNFNYQNFLMLSDALGLAVFAVLGTQIALGVGAHAFVAIIMGVVTGVFGGILRDVLSNRDASILYGDFYALAALFGCTIYVLLLQTSIFPIFALWLSMGVILVLRLIAIYRNWSLPEFNLGDDD